MRLTKHSKKDSLGYEAIKELVKQNNASPIIAKLGQLEDIEDKLGIDLDTLYRAFNHICYKKGNEIKHACHIALIDWAIYVLEESVVNDHIEIGVQGTRLELKDYGKTWALTKEESE